MVAEYAIEKESTDFQLPASLATGVYMGKFNPSGGGVKTTLRLVYEQ